MSAAAEKAVPSGWLETSLGELAEYVTSGSRDWKKYYADEGALFIRTQDIKTNSLVLDNVPTVSLPEKVEGKRTLIQVGDVLITITGNVGRVAVVEHDIGEAYVSQSVALVRLKDPTLAKYIQLQLLTKHAGKTHLESVSYGLGRQVLNLKNIKEAPIKLSPEDLRPRIVAEVEKQFSRLDEAVASLKRVKANLKRYKAAVLKAAVEGKLTEEWRKQNPDVEPASKLLERILAERRTKWEEAELAKMKAKGKEPKNDKWKEKYKEPAQVALSTDSVLPKGWSLSTIECVSLLVTDGDHNPPKRVASGVPHLTARNVMDGRLNEIKCTFITQQDYKKVCKRYEPLVNDVIVTCVGSIGRTAIVSEDYIFSADRNLAIVRLVVNGIEPKFLQLFIDSPSSQDRIHSASGSTAQPHIYLADLRGIQIAVPPSEEQVKIIEKVEQQLSVVSMLDLQIAGEIKRADRLRQSILAQLFGGKVQHSAGVANA